MGTQGTQPSEQHGTDEHEIAVELPIVKKELRSNHAKTELPVSRAIAAIQMTSQFSIFLTFLYRYILLYIDINTYLYIYISLFLYICISMYR